MIQYLPGGEPRLGAGSDVVEFVGGPRNGERVESADPPPQLEAPGGTYDRSVHCADDGALRYVFSPHRDAEGA